MSRPCGLPKTGGRQKNTPNRRTAELQDILEERGINPAEKICELLPSLSPREQVRALLDLMAFVYPKRKPVDSQQGGDEPKTLTELILATLKHKENETAEPT